jgi:hypothetical protein
MPAGGLESSLNACVRTPDGNCCDTSAPFTNSNNPISSVAQYDRLQTTSAFCDILTLGGIRMDQLQAIKQTILSLFWSLLLEGIALVILAILILMYPELLVALAAAMLVMVGIACISLAIKIRTLWSKVPDFMK